MSASKALERTEKTVRRTAQRLIVSVVGQERLIQRLATKPLPEKLMGLIRYGAPDSDIKPLLEQMATKATPGDLARLYRAVRTTADPESVGRIARMAPMWQIMSVKAQPEFSTEILTSHATLYRSALPTGTGPRGMMVCFTDFLDQMFMTITRFLMMIGEHPVDMVMLRAPTPGEFGQGVPGLGDTLHGTVQKLSWLLADRGLKPRAYVGASVGGLYALRAALMMGHCNGVSISGRFYRAGSVVRLEGAGPSFDQLCPCFPAFGVRLHCLYAADETIDCKHAAILQLMRPRARLYPIKRSGEHNPFITLGARRQMASFMALLAETARGGETTFESMMDG